MVRYIVMKGGNVGPDFSTGEIIVREPAMLGYCINEKTAIKILKELDDSSLFPPNYFFIERQVYTHIEGNLSVWIADENYGRQGSAKYYSEFKQD